MLLLRACIALGLCISLAGAATRPKKPADKTIPAPVRQLMRSMTLRDKVAQLIIMPIYGEHANTRTFFPHAYQPRVCNSSAS